MPLTRTWYSSINLALPDTSTALRSHASQWFNFKNQILGALTGTSGPSGAPPASSYWTLESSSDGVTAGAGDNLGGATFTAGKWLRAGAGVAHSWFVAKSPATAGITDGPYYLLVSLGTASDQNCILAISKNPFTGGTITADPTSTGQSTYTTFQFHPNTTTAGRTHFVVDASGNFFFFAGKAGAGLVHSYLFVQALAEARAAGDSYRAVMGAEYWSSARGVPSVTTPFSVRGWLYDGTPMDASTNAGNVCYLAISASSAWASAITQLNPIDAKVEGIPAAYVFNVKTAYQMCRGRIPDVWFCGAGPAVGAGDPSGVAPTRVVLGGMIFPMEVVPVL